MLRLNSFLNTLPNDFIEPLLDFVRGKVSVIDERVATLFELPLAHWEANKVRHDNMIMMFISLLHHAKFEKGIYDDIRHQGEVLHPLISKLILIDRFKAFNINKVCVFTNDILPLTVFGSLVDHRHDKTMSIWATNAAYLVPAFSRFDTKIDAMNLREISQLVSIWRYK